jgi:hypothetical protein
MSTLLAAPEKFQRGTLTIDAPRAQYGPIGWLSRSAGRATRSLLQRSREVWRLRRLLFVKPFAPKISGLPEDHVRRRSGVRCTDNAALGERSCLRGWIITENRSGIYFEKD